MWHFSFLCYRRIQSSNPTKQNGKSDRVRCHDRKGENRTRQTDRQRQTEADRRIETKRLTQTETGRETKKGTERDRQASGGMRETMRERERERGGGGGDLEREIK